MDSSPKHQLCRALISVIAIMSPNGAVRAEENVDVIAYFSRLGGSNKNGWARKTKLVDYCVADCVADSRMTPFSIFGQTP